MSLASSKCVLCLLFDRKTFDPSISSVPQPARSASPVPSLRSVPSMRFRTSAGSPSTTYTSYPAIDTLPSVQKLSANFHVLLLPPLPS